MKFLFVVIWPHHYKVVHLFWQSVYFFWNFCLQPFLCVYRSEWFFSLHTLCAHWVTHSLCTCLYMFQKWEWQKKKKKKAWKWRFRGHRRSQTGSRGNAPGGSQAGDILYLSSKDTPFFWHSMLLNIMLLQTGNSDTLCPLKYKRKHQTLAFANWLPDTLTGHFSV